MTTFEWIFWPAMGLWVLWVGGLIVVQLYKESRSDDARAERKHVGGSS